MKDNYTELNRTIEKLIKLRLNEIIEKTKLNEKAINEIQDINDVIMKENKTNKNKRKKTNIEKKDKKLFAYTLFIKDANCIIKDKTNLNYLPNDVIIEIRKIKDKPAKEHFKELGITWKKLDVNILNKYKNLTKNKDFTNEKYNEISGKPQTPKPLRKKKSKESLK
jgi:hypothetical protein